MNIIIKNTNQCELDVPLKIAQRLYKDFLVKHPNAFFLKTKVKGMRDWDGNVKFISQTGVFKIGLLPLVINKLKEYGYVKGVKVIDMRKPINTKPKIVKEIGNYKLRPEQIKAISSITNNKICNVPFHIGVLDYTVNAGKSLIMSALYYSFKKELRTLLITNDADWLRQSKQEFTQYLPNEPITFIQGKVNGSWNNFSIGMIQSISRNLRYYQNELSKVDMVLVDEADLAGSKQYQTVLTHLINTRVRIGLSGTIYLSKYAKDRLKIMTLKSFFGEVLAQYKLKDSIKDKHSTQTIVKMVPPGKWFGNWVSSEVDYSSIYNDTITKNKYAYQMALDRIRYNLKYNRIPALVVCKFVEHCENLYRYFLKELGDTYNIAYVHVNTPTKLRKKIMEDIRSGKIDILISTTIIARGKNIPKLKYLLNTASMGSQEKSIQFLGRLVRTSEDKSLVHLDDLQFPGNYLSRASKRRKMYYQSEGLKVILLDKLWNKHHK